MNVRPLGDRVLVRRDPEAKVLDSGLALPDRSVEKPRRGTVVRLGRSRMIVPNEEDRDSSEWTGDFQMPFQVAPGDTVFFNRYAGNPVEHMGEELLVMSEEEILAVIPAGEE